MHKLKASFLSSEFEMKWNAFKLIEKVEIFNRRLTCTGTAITLRQTVFGGM